MKKSQILLIIIMFITSIFLVKQGPSIRTKINTSCANNKINSQAVKMDESTQNLRIVYS
jgi:hypothetical protein